MVFLSLSLSSPLSYFGYSRGVRGSGRDLLAGGRGAAGRHAEGGAGRGRRESAGLVAEEERAADFGADGRDDDVLPDPAASVDGLRVVAARNSR